MSDEVRGMALTPPGVDRQPVLILRCDRWRDRRFSRRGLASRCPVLLLRAQPSRDASGDTDADSDADTEDGHGSDSECVTP
jgi:hypothetical protein